MWEQERDKDVEPCSGRPPNIEAQEWGDREVGDITVRARIGPKRFYLLVCIEAA